MAYQYMNKNVYTVVNTVVKEGMGLETLSVVDTSSLVDVGTKILGDRALTELFLNTLAARIGRTIFSFRAYRNKFADYLLNDFEYGAVVQKLTVEMPEAVEDKTYELEDGQSVDQWIVSKPKVNQKFFAKRNAYSFFITIQRHTLKLAFTSESGMASLISMIFGAVRNKMELALENLGRACLNNMIAETASTARNIKLVTEYNAIYEDDVVTSENAMYNPRFLKFMVARIKDVRSFLTDISRTYNDGTIDRFTPMDLQRILIYSPLKTRLETVVESDAFNREFVTLPGFKEVNYWQNPKSPTSINVKKASDELATKVENIACVISDRESFGIYQKDEETLTTPVNARARYYNTFWHSEQMWFNDLSENFVLFTLA